MLHFIRERAQGWVAWFIVGLITIPFALWGVNSYMTGPADVVVATVNGEPVKQAEFQQAFQQYRDRMRNMMGDKFDPQMFEGLAIKQNVLNGLIEQRLLLSAGYSSGQRVSDKILFETIRATPAFQKEGVFNPEYYEMVLARVGFNPARYENDLRNDMITQQLTDNVQQTAFIPNFRLDDVLRLEKQTRDIAYGVVSAQAQLNRISVNDEDVSDYYNLHKAKFMAPERVAVDYLELSVDELVKTIEVDEAELQQFYVDNESQFVGPEQRRASHILIEGDDKAALATIDTILERLNNGDDFALLATEFSQDTGSASEGGDLGYFQRDVMDADFEQAVFDMKAVGEVSEPIKTEFGYHLIKLTGIQAAEGKSFTQAREQIESVYRRQQAEELFYEKAEQLADISYENPDSLDMTAESVELEILSTEAFTRDGGIGIAANDKVVDVAFSEDVLVNNLNSAVIELSKSHLVVIHKKEHIQASQLPYESVAPAIKEQLRFERASEKARVDGEAILAQIKSGVAPESLFEPEQWQATQAYSRISKNVSAQVLQQAFSVSKPSDEPRFTGFTANNGNYIVVQVSAVHDGNPDDTTQEDRDGLQSHLLRIAGNSELQSFINSLREQAEIKIFEQNL